MSLSTTTLVQLENRVSELYSQIGQEQCKVLIEAVADNPKLLTGEVEANVFKLRGSLKLQEKILLGVFAWFVPKELQYLIFFELEEIWGGERREVLAVLEQSKLTALGYLLVSDDWNDYDFWGNVLTTKTVEKVFSKFPAKLWQWRQKPKRLIRRRGYRDKGSQRPSHEPEPSYDYKKLKSVIDLELEELAYRQKVIALQDEIDLRIRVERTNSFLDSISFL